MRYLFLSRWSLVMAASSSSSSSPADTERFLLSSLCQTALLVFTSTILRDAKTLCHIVHLGCLETSASLSFSLLSSGARVFSLYQLYNLIELQSDSRKHTHVISHLLPRALPLFRLFNDTEADLAKY